MVSYSEVKQEASELCDTIVDDMLKKIAYEQFEKDRGKNPTQVFLSENTTDYEFETGDFRGSISYDRTGRLQGFVNPVYDDTSITGSDVLCYGRQGCLEMVNSLYDCWWDVFGDNPHKITHPGEPPVSKDVLEDKVKQMHDSREVMIANPGLNDFVNCIKDKNYGMCVRFLNLDVEPNTLLNPGGPHELSDLFTNGEIDIMYKDMDIVVLKPQYNHDIREEVINEKSSSWRTFRLSGEQPELAFVVGVDDTPQGLFAHAVDGTRLDKDSDFNRGYINDVMGFDKNYRKENNLDMSSGQRIRLQGDLAIECISDEYERDKYIQSSTDVNESMSRCNLPIDNHMCILNHAKSGEMDTEPVHVSIKKGSNLNILHDEHDNVNTYLFPGEYKFYILARGAKPENERPNW
jgi:hypothetical protein